MRRTRSQKEPDKDCQQAPTPARVTRDPRVDPLELQTRAGNAVVNHLVNGHLQTHGVVSVQRGSRSASALRGPTGRTAQPGMTVGAADDIYEREADRIAETVLRRLSDPERGSETSVDTTSTEPQVQRVTSLNEGGRYGDGELDADEEQAIRSAGASGRPLEHDVRAEMERGFGVDLGAVRIHADARADTLNRSLASDALTSGRDIFFRSGTYAPRVRRGTALLAHELAHTIQQGAVDQNSRIRRSSAAPRAGQAGGAPLEPGRQQRLGHDMGAGLSGVRLHTDGGADTLNRSLGALAFTAGQDIFPRRGEYGSGDGARRLLGHELTHVVQHRSTTAQRIQRKVPSSAHAGQMDEFNRIEKRPSGTPHKDQGIASQPVNFHAPDFRIVVKPGKFQVTAKVELVGKASIGDSEATYLAAGLHDSGFLWASDELYDGHPVSNRMLAPAAAGRGDTEHVIFNVSSSVAKGSKAAELEHLEDYREAYRLTLQAAQDAIKAVSKRRFKGHKASEAKIAANRALLAELTARSNGHLKSLIRTDWEEAYRTLFRRSGVRDTNGWHLQSLSESGTLAQTWKGFPARFVDVAPSLTFRLGVSSKDHIDPGPAVPVQTIGPNLDQDLADNDEGL